MKTNELKASEIKAERLQTRAVTDSAWVDEIAERMLAGDTFPDITIFTDGKESWLSDGIHRLEGAIKAKKPIGVNNRKGTRADAIEHACGANASHGLRRSNKDKRRAVTLALSEFPTRSSRAISELCGVSDHLVEEIRGAHSRTSPETRTGKDGKEQPVIKSTTRSAPPSKSPDRATSQTTDEPATSPHGAESPPAMVPARDGWGAPIQPHARGAFEAVPNFDEIIRLLRQASRLFTQLAEMEGGKLLQESSFVVNGRSGFRHSGITNAIHDLDNSRPTHTLCPYSVNENQKHGEDCTLCHGLNWSPKLSDRVPERLISKAREAACST